MAAPQHPPNSPENRAKRAFKALAQVRGTLYNRLADHILSNRSRLREEAAGTEHGSFTLHAIDEQFLSKMNILDRAMGELSRPEPKEGHTTTTTYETIEVIAKREELPQKIADALAERGESDFLDLCVLRADENSAEVLLVLAREDHVVISKPVLALAEKQEQESPSGQVGAGAAKGPNVAGPNKAGGASGSASSKPGAIDSGDESPH